MKPPQRAIASGGAQGHTPIRQAVIDYSILYLEIDQIVRRLIAMHSAIVRLILGK
jgi:hypothetical protein